MLTAQHITKKFAGVTALNDVCMELHPGKVNAIIGENGAGKSTLMKILSGVYQDYEGEILLHGKPVRFSGTRQAQEMGIAIIHQELNLIPFLSITENIFLGREIVNALGALNKTAMGRQTRQLLEKLRLHVDPGTRINALKVGQQQVVEIAKALLLDSEVIIMDEPTSAISESEVAVLFEIIADLKKAGKTIVYISHKLDELFRIADRYIVLRDGRSIESGDIYGMPADALIQKMVGRNITLTKKAGAENCGGKLLEVQDLNLKHNGSNGSNILKNISFNVAAGEVLGVFGLMGAGRTELLETLFGLHYANTTGRIAVDGSPVKIKKPADAVGYGLALVPEDRKKDGIVPGMDIKQNISLCNLESVLSGGVLNGKKERGLADKYIKELSIKTSSQKQLIKNLSGGNQQKVVLAKWLATHPKLLMLDEPTRGIDIYAKTEIYKLILELAQAGLGIIMVSSELPEIFAVSDRIMVLSEGRQTGIFNVQDATEDILLKAAIPKTL